MLNGDVAETPLSVTLEFLALQSATGCLHITDPAGDESLVYLRAGALCVVVMPRPGRPLGTRLVSSGALGPEALAEALSGQGDGHTDAPDRALGELLVGQGWADGSAVEAFAIEQLLADGAKLIGLAAGRWQFIDDETMRGGVPDGVLPAELLLEVQERQRAMDLLAGLVPGPQVIPALSGLSELSVLLELPGAGTAVDNRELSADAWAVLSVADGARSLQEIAQRCAFTMFEATSVVADLVDRGSLEIVGGASAAVEIVAPNVEVIDLAAGAVVPAEAVESAPVSLLQPDLRNAAALLSELSRELIPEVVEVPPDPVEAKPMSVVADMPAVNRDNDTAALMRELSFLGLDDSPDSPPSPAKAPAPENPRSISAANQKKRKGLFGR